MTDRAAVGRRSRNKGAAFERLVVNMIKGAWPDVDVRRGKQSHLADEPDVVVTAADVRGDLWIECQHANAPSPASKMDQARRDSERADDTPLSETRVPVVVWRRTGARAILATTSLTILVWLIHGDMRAGAGDVLVTVDLADLLSALAVPVPG